MKSIILKNLLFSFSLFGFLNNSTAQWMQSSSGMEDRNVRALAVSGNNMFAGTYYNSFSGGVFKSTDRGISWTQTSLNNSYVLSLAVNGNYVFAGGSESGGDVYKSSNNGTNWSASSLIDLWVFALAVNGNNVFAGTWSIPHPGTEPRGLYLSTNSGINWTQTALNNRNIYSLAVNGSNIFAGMYDSYGVYKSSDSGTTWTQTSLNNLRVFSLAVNGNNVFAGTFPNTGLFLSTDSGTNWILTSLNNQSIYSLAVNGNNVFAGTNGNGVFVSNDNGISWTQRNDGLENLSIRAFCILDNFIYAGTNGSSVYKRPLSELVGIMPISSKTPTEFLLSQNYPNPFNPTTHLEFGISELGFVSLKVYDILGNEVKTLVNENKPAGSYSVDFDGADLPSGIYFYKLESGDFSDTKRMILLK